MSFIKVDAVEFIRVLSSSDPVPGGGGASALVGAVGTALGNMVGSLTTGKKRYADVEEDIARLQKASYELQDEFLRLVDEDAVAFEPLSKAYSIPRDDPNRDQIMEDALRVATSTPIDIMRACAKAIDIIEEFAAKGSSLAISDAGVGVIFCKAAMQGASLNVYINTKSMADKEYAANVEKEADALLEKYCALADTIFASVVAKLR